MPDTTLKIVIADDHRIVTGGIYSFLQQQPGMDVVGVAETGREALRLCGELQPDIMILDFFMPDMTGLEVTRQIRSQYPEIDIIALTGSGDRKTIRKMLRAGARGYVEKKETLENLLKAIDAVAGGQLFLSDTACRQALEDYISLLSFLPDEDLPDAAALSAREHQVLQCLYEVKTTKEFSEALTISTNTV